jgi:hypothetical protein
MPFLYSACFRTKKRFHTAALTFFPALFSKLNRYLTAIVFKLVCVGVAGFRLVHSLGSLEGWKMWRCKKMGNATKRDLDEADAATSGTFQIALGLLQALAALTYCVNVWAIWGRFLLSFLPFQTRSLNAERSRNC